MNNKYCQTEGYLTNDLLNRYKPESGNVTIPDTHQYVPHNTPPLLTPTGWQCCQCKAVMSPTYPTCWYCKPVQSQAITGITDGIGIAPYPLKTGTITTKSSDGKQSTNVKWPNK